MRAHFLLFLANLPVRIGGLLLIALLASCANKDPNPIFYHQSGQTAQMVICPQGEYELCLKKMSDACQNLGYTVQEKIRQIKEGFWSDSAQILMIGQCKTSPNLAK